MKTSWVQGVWELLAYAHPSVWNPPSLLCLCQLWLHDSIWNKAPNLPDRVMLPGRELPWALEFLLHVTVTTFQAAFPPAAFSLTQSRRSFLGLPKYLKGHLDLVKKIWNRGPCFTCCWILDPFRIDGFSLEL